MGGREIAGFRIVSEVEGRHAGRVFRARQSALDRDVALWLLPAGEAGSDRETLARAKAVARITHPNLPRTYDVGRDGPQVYVAAELIEGQDLESVLASGSPMGCRRAVAIASQMASALAALHREGIAHGGLQPAGVVVGADGEAVIIDAVAGREGAEAADDVRALGGILYRMLAGDPLPAGVAAVVALRRRCPDAPDRLVELTAACLTADPDAALPSAERLGDDLSQIALEMDFAALAQETGTRAEPSLYSTRTVAALRTERRAAQGPIALLMSCLRRAWSRAADSFDPDVVAMRRCTARMQQALDRLAEAKAERSRLAARARQHREEAAKARHRSGDAFDSDDVGLAEELADRERQCEADAVELEAAAGLLADRIPALEADYTRAREEHERRRLKVDMAQAEALGGARGRRLRPNEVRLLIALALVVVAACVWIGIAVAGHGRTESATPRPTPRPSPRPPSYSVAQRPATSTQALGRAAQWGDVEAVRKILEAGGPSASQARMGAALRQAAGNGHVQVVALLLQHGALPDGRDPDTRRTALQDAARGGQVETTRQLLEAGADPNARDYLGRTPLQDAAEGGHTEVVGVLLAGGADIEAAASSGATALHEAAGNAHPETVKALLAAGASPAAVDGRGRTSLHLAAAVGDEASADLLIEAGADVNARDARGQTPLKYAEMEGEAKMAALLATHGGRE